MKIIKHFVFIFAILSSIGTTAQTLRTKYEVGGTLGNGKYTPMWHFCNRQGVGSPKGNWVYANVGIKGEHTFSKSGISLDWGAVVTGGYNLTSNIFAQQAYLDVSWRKARISFGQKERWGELMNHRLTTGSLVESSNARPIPQIRFDLPDYWNIPGTNGWLAIKGHLAYGFFTDGCWQESFAMDGTTYTKNALYHSKAGYMRIGNEEKFPLTAEIGLHMVTMFGGDCYNYGDKEGNNYKNPVRLKDFLTALIPQSGDNSYHPMDQGNIVGNMLGSWLGAITWNAEQWRLKLYYEHVFDDHSQMFWEYGLWTEQLVGIELDLRNFKWIRGVNLEYFNLKNHSGPIYHDSNSEIPDQISCRDDNYNHEWYPGWFNYGMIIGTPLCTSPIYNENQKLICYNNRVETFHIGIEGDILSWLNYRFLLTHSNNWGTYNYPFIEMKKNTSGLAELTFKPTFMKKWSITTSFAFDTGELYGSNYGGMITITHNNVFKF